jgi:hypothetical protein
MLIETMERYWYMSTYTTFGSNQAENINNALGEHTDLAVYFGNASHL